MTRTEVVQKIVARVDDWELDELLDYVRGDMEDWANSLDDTELLTHHNESGLIEEKIETIECG